MLRIVELLSFIVFQAQGAWFHLAPYLWTMVFELRWVTQLHRTSMLLRRMPTLIRFEYKHCVNHTLFGLPPHSITGNGEWTWLQLPATLLVANSLLRHTIRCKCCQSSRMPSRNSVKRCTSTSLRSSVGLSHRWHWLHLCILDRIKSCYPIQ